MHRSFVSSSAYLPLIPCVMLLAACSSPPKPPAVDESQRRPVNSQTLVELQVCKNDLQNTRLLAAESGRLADTTASTLASMAARQQALALLTARAMPMDDDRPPVHENAAHSADRPDHANSVHVVHFAFASSYVQMAADVRHALITQAKAAPLVYLRGRTDGSSDAPSESRIARERALAVRDLLVSGGVDPARIRVTYQPAGDHLAENISDSGRALNRRVEIELYRTLPMAMAVPSSQQAGRHAGQQVLP